MFKTGWQDVMKRSEGKKLYHTQTNYPMNTPVIIQLLFFLPAQVSLWRVQSFIWHSTEPISTHQEIIIKDERSWIACGFLQYRSVRAAGPGVALRGITDQTQPRRIRSCGTKIRVVEGFGITPFWARPQGVIFTWMVTVAGPTFCTHENLFA